MYQIIASNPMRTIAVMPDKTTAKLFAESYGYVNHCLAAAFPVVDMSYCKDFLGMLTQLDDNSVDKNDRFHRDIYSRNLSMQAVVK